MIGHLGINVPDLDVARSYYGALMPLLNFVPFIDDDDQFAYRPGGDKPGTFLFIYRSAEEGDYANTRTGLQHLAFMVPSRAAVEEVHQAVISLGSEVVHEPRHFPEYPPPYYACFWHDPFGFLLEAVCHRDA